MLADWIAVDWGTTHLRAWAMSAAGEVQATAASDAGMNGLSRDGFEPALLDLVGGWLAEGRQTPVIACGMVGARQGWAEAPYRAVPCTPLDAGAMIAAPCSDPRLSVRLIAGLSQASPADVMRGEETQIAGLLAARPDFDGVLCLPGTHSKWARISAGEVVSFQTFMTGELFALLAEQSVLRHSVAAAGWDDDAFAEALSDAISRPDRIGARLFTLRAEALLSGLAPEAARARLSGALIGVELAAARPYWLGQDIAVIGAAGIAGTYVAALTAQGALPQQYDGDEMTRAGLTAAHAQRKGASQ
ncbi:2-dehydro-3-deoxygalactonokinase [Acidimangrovimonas pyrenivorans]|uniref:2-dehydro-3-deoxygalactonokinase n=1 Tax=Acidimangrovimonas pyrenivorans TaxID=2030798 RepID=A0ABV7AL67_9RHOB